MVASYCENCGKESHCGGEARMQVNAHDVGVYEVVVCRHCNCNNCNPKEKDNGS